MTAFATKEGRIRAGILQSERLCEDIFRLVIDYPRADEVKPGQFFNVYLDDGAHLLPRPISVCEAGEGRLSLVFRKVGYGTEDLSKRTAGESLWLLGPLGNGYPLSDIPRDQSILLVGGGLGVPPMLALAQALKKEGRTFAVALGFRDESFLRAEFEAAGAPLYLASDTGRVGEKGTALDLIKAHGLRPDVILSCGPKPMLVAVKDYAGGQGIEAYISLEERMACGIGACLACVCETPEPDAHSRVHNRRVCKDGPVFKAEEVAL